MSPRTDNAIERPPSLPEIVAERITDMILSGVIEPGDRLVENKLASKFEVSRGPVRDAFKILAVEGLVTMRGTKGAYVAKPSAGEVEEMFVMRAVLEGVAARFASTSADEKQLGELEKIVAQMKTAAERRNYTRFRELDWDFHEAVCAMSGVAALVQTWKSMRNLIRMYQKANLATDQDLQRTAANHLEFVEVIRAGRPDRAEMFFRSKLIHRGYELIGKEPPPALRGLVDFDKSA